MYSFFYKKIFLGQYLVILLTQNKTQDQTLLFTHAVLNIKFHECTYIKTSSGVRCNLLLNVHWMILKYSTISMSHLPNRSLIIMAWKGGQLEIGMAAVSVIGEVINYIHQTIRINSIQQQHNAKSINKISLDIKVTWRSMGFEHVTKQIYAGVFPQTFKKCILFF